MSTELAKREAAELDHATIARVVDSLVLRGDISELSPKDRAGYYTQLCEALGLNPMAQPFAVLRLNGKEVLYPTRGCTDQLSAIHRINREIIDGPKVIDLAGTKLVYCQCRATHPNRRTETSVATVPLVDPVNVYMKAETKAKRRATLSILGLAMLDEMELETIPDSAKSAADPINIGNVNAPEDHHGEIAPSIEITPIDALRNALVAASTPEQVASAWCDHGDTLRAITEVERGNVWNLALKRGSELKLTSKDALRKLVTAEQMRRKETTTAKPASAPSASTSDDEERRAIEAQDSPASTPGTPAQHTMAAWDEYLRGIEDSSEHVAAGYALYVEDYKRAGCSAEKLQDKAIARMMDLAPGKNVDNLLSQLSNAVQKRLERERKSK